jgi:hypothetical protein
MAVYFSEDWSLENKLQSLDRVYRIGTKVSPIYINLIMDAPRWVDGKIYEAHLRGRDYVADLNEQMSDLTGATPDLH